MTTFTDKYTARVADGKYICVGLDPDINQIPACVPGETSAERVYNFVVAIIAATDVYAAAYKLQSAYYEDLGDDGPATLRRIVEYIHAHFPSTPIILDYKRGDIGRTNEPYVREAFDFYGVDAVTVHPYLGMEAMQPFLDRADKTIIVLCRTSNDGAAEFQDVQCTVWFSHTTHKWYSTTDEAQRDGANLSDLTTGVMPLYAFVAQRVALSWNKAGNCAVVVGATYPEELREVRNSLTDGMLILIPGLGTQGGDLAEAIGNGKGINEWDIILNNSSAILFAYLKLKNGDKTPKYQPEDYAQAAAEAASVMNIAVHELVKS